MTSMPPGEERTPDDIEVLLRQTGLSRRSHALKARHQSFRMLQDALTDMGYSREKALDLLSTLARYHIYWFIIDRITAALSDARRHTKASADAELSFGMKLIVGLWDQWCPSGRRVKTVRLVPSRAGGRGAFGWRTALPGVEMARGTDQEDRASIDREDGATGGDRVGLKITGAY